MLKCVRGLEVVNVKVYFREKSMLKCVREREVVNLEVCEGSRRCKC